MVMAPIGKAQRDQMRDALHGIRTEPLNEHRMRRSMIRAGMEIREDFESPGREHRKHSFGMVCKLLYHKTKAR